MGGFISSTGYPVATKKQLAEESDLGSEFLKGIESISTKDIADKSKGDTLSKTVALAQGLWFTLQCLARVHQQLTVTELEVATLAFAVVNILIWLLWWCKPLDIQQPMVVGPPKPLDAQPIVPHPPQALDRFLYIIFGAYNDEDDYDPLSSTSVPSFWSLPMDNDLRLGTTGITSLAGSVFGAIHCTAWNTDFPTAAEMWIWRSCSVRIAVLPAVTLLLLLLITIINETTLEKTLLGAAIETIAPAVFFVSLPIYIIARLILITLPLAALRSLSPSVFVDINWSTYIPHI